MSDTPRTDAHLEHLNLPNGQKIGIPDVTLALMKQLERELSEPCEDCDHGIRGGEPCQSCGGCGRVLIADLLAATQRHVKELKASRPEERAQLGLFIVVLFKKKQERRVVLSVYAPDLEKAKRMALGRYMGEWVVERAIAKADPTVFRVHDDAWYVHDDEPDPHHNAAPQVSDSASVGSKLEHPEPRTGPAIVNSPAGAAPCCHPWRGEGPPPSSWYCCGVKVYRSYADYCD